MFIPLVYILAQQESVNSNLVQTETVTPRMNIPQPEAVQRNQILYINTVIDAVQDTVPQSVK